ncbi:hypothetical protein PC9H_009193 [Pleurotus ostreatus]|uniref:Uncharacterized protein n=1 Tax=Pleurotus ostreatus TaxID=5322 RepID=A0A8H7DPR7_PLEOS|nr:uncharacterized protein PC9H_009193 [Pleurotus ostreatus]KAF7426824.1 hypothetical protein PC9H_009193 [Pleurotus ostreatus]KAJ8694437.1 hypothetical protein PTI98_009361 [Pleurotus ostreatus]
MSSPRTLEPHNPHARTWATLRQTAGQRSGEHSSSVKMPSTNSPHPTPPPASETAKARSSAIYHPPLLSNPAL